MPQRERPGQRSQQQQCALLLCCGSRLPSPRRMFFCHETALPSVVNVRYVRTPRVKHALCPWKSPNKNQHVGRRFSIGPLV